MHTLVKKKTLYVISMFISVSGGGFHHCSASEGGGFCVYADITLAVKVAML